LIIFKSAISFLEKVTSKNLTPDPSPAERGAIHPRLAPLSAATMELERGRG
jgi:hypothetical protein